MGGEVGAGRPAGRARGHRPKRGLLGVAHERVGVVPHRLLRRDWDAGDVLIPQAAGIEADLVEQAGVVGDLARPGDRLPAEAAELHGAARVVVERRPAEKLGGGRADAAELMPRFKRPVHQPVEGPHTQGAAEEHGRSEAQLGEPCLQHSSTSERRHLGPGNYPRPLLGKALAQDAAPLRCRHWQRHREGDGLPSSGTILPPACGSALVDRPAEADTGQHGQRIADVADQVASVHGLASWDAIWIS